MEVIPSHRRFALVMACILVLSHNFMNLNSNFGNLEFQSANNTLQETPFDNQQITEVEDDSLALLKRRLLSAMMENNRRGMSKRSRYNASQKKILWEADHFHMKPYQLSPGHSVGHSYEVINSLERNITWNPLKHGGQGPQRFICDCQMGGSSRHFPHFAQHAFPCVSGFIELMELNKRAWQNASEIHKIEYLIVLRDGRKQYKQWIRGCLEAFEVAGISHLIFFGNLDELRGQNVWEMKRKEGWSNGWPKISRPSKAILTTNAHNAAPVEMNNVRYFSKRRDIELFQKWVLGSRFKHGPSKSQLPIKMLMIDRRKKDRHWLFSEQTRDLLEATWNKDSNTPVLEIEVVENMNGNLTSQAEIVHSVDVIITPHGAQNANMVFIRPCTVVLELFNPGYYMAFFQPSVLTADGISYEGIHADTFNRVFSRWEGFDRRTQPILTSPESVEFILPRLLFDHITCKENWSA